MNSTRLPRFVYVAVFVPLGLFLITQWDRFLPNTPMDFNSHDSRGAYEFVQFLTKLGYNVRFDPSEDPTVKPGELAIFCGKEYGLEPQLPDEFRSHVQKGGAALAIAMPSEAFIDARSEELCRWDSDPVVDVRIARKGKWSNYSFYNDLPPRGEKIKSFGLLTSGSSASIAEAYAIGKGYVYTISDSTIIENEDLGALDNADMVMKLLAMAAPESKSIVISTHFLTSGQPGAVEMLGPWALAAWRQLLLVGILTVWALGKGFGFPITERRSQKGSKEFIDGFSAVLESGKRQRFALKREIDAQMTEIRRRYGVRNDDSEEVFLTRVPKAVADAVRTAQTVHAKERLSAREAWKAAQALERAVKEAEDPAKFNKPL